MDKSVRTRVKTGGIYFQHSSSDRRPDNLDVRHCHEEYEILYIVEGVGKYVIEGAEYSIRARTLFFAPPFFYHSVQLGQDCAYERYVLQFDSKDLTPETQSFLISLDKSLKGMGGYYAADTISPAIMSLFERFEYGDGLPERERKEYIKLLTSEIILLLSVASRERVPRDEGELGVRVIKYLNEHIDKDVSLDTLAKRFFVSKYYLCRAFKKHNGISVHGYINQKRVMYAKQLIESGETASGAAYRVGFGDYSAFYRAYVKHIGRAPTSKQDGKDRE